VGKAWEMAEGTAEGMAGGRVGDSLAKTVAPW
jgi:hypothetical protein